jgi:hypothetical protein
MVEKHTKAVDVAEEPGRVVSPRESRSDDLRRRVKDRPAVFPRARIHVLGQHARTEVSQLHSLCRDEDVLRFDVPVRHAHAMQVNATLEDLLEDAEQLVIAGDEAFLAFVQKLRQRDGGEVLHLDRVPLALWRNAPHPVDVDHARMRGLTNERRTFGQLVVPLPLRLGDLHRDDGAVRASLGSPDPPVRAVAQTLDELVALTEATVDPRHKELGRHDSPRRMMFSSRSRPSCPARTTNW